MIQQLQLTEVFDHEARSFTNKVRYYRDELILITNGRTSGKVFSKHVSRGLARDGVLVMDYSKKPHRHSLSERAIQVLNLLNQEEVE